MVLLKSFRNIFAISELRKKIFFVLGVLIINRLGTYIPVIGINVPMLSDLMQQKSGIGGILGFFDIFSGGALSRCTVFALGIQPYISASIFMQILGMTVPSFEQLVKEGEYGRKIINQYTRYLALVMSIVTSFSLALFLENQNMVLVPGWGFKVTFVLTLTAGSMLIMWMGDQISLHGIGNGSSVLIFAGILSNYPTHALKLMAMIEQGNTHILKALAVVLVYLLITAGIVFLEKGDRKIPVHYARRVVGNKVYGGQSTYIPFKINSAGVMPVIFASTVIRFPLIIAGMLSSYLPTLQMVVQSFYSGPLLTVVDFLLVIMFSFFYTALFVNPTELAENIRKGGGFVPGLRPGKQTADFFNYTLTRVGLVGAIYLATLAILPTILQSVLHIPFEESGTGMLIVIGVALELANQIESYLIERRYEGFLRSGRTKNRTALS